MVIKSSAQNGFQQNKFFTSFPLYKVCLVYSSINFEKACWNGNVVGQGQIYVLIIAISTTFIMEIQNVNVQSQIVKWFGAKRNTL